MLRLPITTINQIAQRAEPSNFNKNDSQKDCYVTMLNEWQKLSDNCTTVEFFRALESPAVALSHDIIDEVKSKIQCKIKFVRKKCKPDAIQIEFMDMMFDIIKLLNNSDNKLTEAKDKLSLLINYDSTPMLDSSFLDNITSWKCLIKKICDNGMCTVYDVDWFIILTEKIANCPVAVDRIKEYKEKTRNISLHDKILWEDTPDYSKKGIIQTKTTKSFETVVLQDYDKSKDNTSAVLGLNKTVMVPISCTESSVSYNWMVPFELISTLQLPKSITKFLKEKCEEAEIIKISAFAGNQKKILTLNELTMEKGLLQLRGNCDQIIYPCF